MWDIKQFDKGNFHLGVSRSEVMCTQQFLYNCTVSENDLSFINLRAQSIFNELHILSAWCVLTAKEDELCMGQKPVY